MQCYDNICDSLLYISFKVELQTSGYVNVFVTSVSIEKLLRPHQ